ncbi:TPA: GTP 3',8-cyclase MoaA, partial [Bacillus anthracis]|nr:GTP 3',8-cyclase MoaA [Bacillus anthracis]
RISADGKFYTCLFGEKGTDLRSLLRENISDASLLKILQHTWEFRTDRYSDERTAESTNKRQKVEMSYIGG